MQMRASLGGTADFAADGQAAVEAVQGRDYDLVLMDVQIPVMDGLEATRRIRALAGRRQPRICAMSASVLDEERQACIDACGQKAETPDSSEMIGSTDNMAMAPAAATPNLRSEEHTSEPQSLRRISYVVFCLKKKTQKNN